MAGGSSRSYGIQVARLAGIPKAVTNRASEILSNLEKQELDPSGRPAVSRGTDRSESLETPRQAWLFGNPAEDLLQELADVNPNDLTPLQALTLLVEWKGKFC